MKGADKNEDESKRIEGLTEMARTAQESENWDAAIKYWEQVILHDAKHADAWLGKGQCLLQMAIEERPDEAVGLRFLYFEKLLGIGNLGGERRK